MTKVICKLQICKRDPVFYPGLPVTMVTFETTFFLKHCSPVTHGECYLTLCVCVSTSVCGREAPTRSDFLGIVTIFAQHLSVGAQQVSLHCLRNRSCLGYQGLGGVVKEASPGKPEEGAGKEGGQGLREFRDVF